MHRRPSILFPRSQPISSPSSVNRKPLTSEWTQVWHSGRSAVGTNHWIMADERGWKGWLGADFSDNFEMVFSDVFRRVWQCLVCRFFVDSQVLAEKERRFVSTASGSSLLSTRGDAENIWKHSIKWSKQLSNSFPTCSKTCSNINSSGFRRVVLGGALTAALWIHADKHHARRLLTVPRVAERFGWGQDQARSEMSWEVSALQIVCFDWIHFLMEGPVVVG